jgi:hypothetical protein
MSSLIRQHISTGRDGTTVQYSKLNPRRWTGAPKGMNDIYNSTRQHYQQITAITTDDHCHLNNKVASHGSDISPSDKNSD